MSCKALKLSSCEIKGSTFAGRKFTFPNRDISEDTFVAKVRAFYGSQTVTTIQGVKDDDGNVYFSKSTLENNPKGKHTIEYWATFQGIATELIAVEDFKISIDACDCGDSEDSTFTLTFPEETIEYSVEIAVINIGGGGGESLTPLQIKTRYESNANTNAFTDNEKTKLQSLQNYNDSALIAEIATKASVTYVNETFQPIGNYLIASDIANLASLSYVNSTFATIETTYTKTEVDGLLTAVYRSKGSVDNFASLPTTNRRAGDVWNLIDTGDNYVWVSNLNNTGVAGWDKLSGVVDLSAYQTTSSADAKYFTITDAANKVDKESGKGLSQNDFTSTLKTKLEGLSNYTLPVASGTVLGGVKEVFLTQSAYDALTPKLADVKYHIEKV